jgi:WD40 repeat protein
MRLAMCVVICFTGSAMSFGQGPKLIRVLRGHEAAVLEVAFSPDGKLLASSQMGGDVRLWEASSGKELAILYNGLNGVRYHCGSLVFSADGKLLAGGLEGRWILLWDVATHSQLGTVETRQSIYPRCNSCIAFQPNGKSLLSQSYDSDGNPVIVISDVATFKTTVATRVNLGDSCCMAFSPDCRAFAVEGPSKHGTVVELYETATGKKIGALEGPGYFGRDIAFSPDGKIVAATIYQEEGNGMVQLWDVATGKYVARFKGSAKYPKGIAFSPDGKTLASGNMYERAIELWDTLSGKLIKKFKSDTKGGDSADCLSFSPDGKVLASGGGYDGMFGTIELWRLEGGTNNGVGNH